MLTLIRMWLEAPVVRYDRPRQGRGNTRYLNVLPSKKALVREREKLRTLIATGQSHTPLPQLVARLNRHLEGWANYFRYGYPALAAAQSEAVSSAGRCGLV